MVKKCNISKILMTPRVLGNINANPPIPDVPAIQTTGAKFEINNAKDYAPKVTLSINDNIKFLENVNQGFKKNNFLEQI